MAVMDLVKESDVDSVRIELAEPMSMAHSDLRTSRMVTWLAKQDGCVAGSVNLHWQQQVAMIRELHLLADSASRQFVTRKLLEAVADFARDHGILKVTIHHSCVAPGVAAAMERMGYRDGALRHRGGSMVFYLDLYQSKSKPNGRPEALTHASTLRLAC